MRLIDADRLMVQVTSHEDFRSLVTDEYTQAQNDAYQIVEYDIEDAPTVDAEPVRHGKWIDWLGKGNEWECSECKCSIESHGSIAYEYCPMCGARMDGEEQEHE